DFPRQQLFNAVADAIDGLWPDLYTIGVEEVWATGEAVELPSNVGGIIDVRAYENGQWRPLVSWDFLPNFPLSSTGVAVQLESCASTPLHVKYRGIPQRP